MNSNAVSTPAHDDLNRRRFLKMASVAAAAAAVGIRLSGMSHTAPR